jgi:hypothetical protein
MTAANVRTFSSPSNGMPPLDSAKAVFAPVFPLSLNITSFTILHPFRLRLLLLWRSQFYSVSSRAYYCILD